MTVVLVDPRRPALVPIQALPLLTGAVAYTEELPVAVVWALPAARPAHAGADAPVLFSSDRHHPQVVARVTAGEPVIGAPATPTGERLIDAVALIDRLRTTGPWESEQTHDSLCRFLLEETYELLDAVRSGNAEELQQELGDVLLQVLFHARIAEDAVEHPFTIDDVADTLLRKLANRVPAVLAGQQISRDDQLRQWEERKALEKKATGSLSRQSIMDGVSTAQPALALAAKVLHRAAGASIPPDLIPAAITTVTVAAGVDSENRLRTTVLKFIDTIREAERQIAAARCGGRLTEALLAGSGSITEREWRAHWPVAPGIAEPPAGVEAG